MKEIKAYVHAHRIGEVIAALKSSATWGVGGGPSHLAVHVVQGSLPPIDERERHYSVELGDEVVNEYKLELLCDDAQVDELVGIVRTAARTGQATAGWICVTELLQAQPIR